MGFVRSPAVAGMFYPADPATLARDVRSLLDSAARPGAARPKAIIAPHAGYIYSGPVAASVYARLIPARHDVSRVVLVGPSHRVAFRGIAASSADAFDTPLGRINVDRDSINGLLVLPGVAVLDAAHSEEHSLEVHLPFLQAIFDRFTLVPLVVGDASADSVAAVLDALWGGSETLIVVSSDLSHYLDYKAARGVDLATRDAIERLDPAAITFDQACGRLPIAGLLTVARRRDLTVETVDLRNSGDTAGPRDQVVGYGAWCFTEPETAADTDSGRASLHQHAAQLLSIARSAIEKRLKSGGPSEMPGDLPPALLAAGATFVTLMHHGELRGCIGSTTAWRPLAADVAENALRAAFEDPRFPPMTEDEWTDTDLSISVLTAPQLIIAADEADLVAKLRPHADGLIIEDGQYRALFLPAVWKVLPEPRDFLAQLKRKAGLAPTHWSPNLRAYRFATEDIR